MLGEALRKNPEVVRLNFIQKWNGVLPRVISGDNGGVMLMLNDTDDANPASQ